VGCVTWLFLIAGFIFVVMTLIRWFDETAEAVDAGWWDRVQLLSVFPFGVWLFPTKVGAGRATPVPRHEPVRGFGTVSKTPVVKVEERPAEEERPAQADRPVAAVPVSSSDEPPPGTPREFLGIPKVPPTKPR